MKSIIITALTLGLTLSVSATETENKVTAQQYITQSISQLKPQLAQKVRSDIQNSLQTFYIKTQRQVKTNKLVSPKNMFTMNQQE